MIMHGSSAPVGSWLKPELGGIAPCIEADPPYRRPTIDVCICTYYRTGVLDALRGVATQSVRSEIPIRIIVADNALHPEAQSRVLAAAQELDLDLLYVHAPANNISIARNACLEHARADWIVFLDDDEVPCRDWLKALLEESEQSGWDVILGPVDAVYPEATPTWLAAGNFHSTRPVWVRGRIETGYTGNVMIRRTLVTDLGLRFREELGCSGGEDLDFFYRLRAQGGKIGFAPQALAYEAVPEERATLAWLLKRSFRAGQSHGAYLVSHGGRMPHIILATGKATVCGLAALLSFPAARRRNRYLTRAALHCGVVARLAGYAEIKLY
jgi:succinoglycan biosynthesis protein ExoM